MVRRRTPNSFLSLYDAVERLLGATAPPPPACTARLYPLPPSLRMIADRLDSSKSLQELAVETKLPVWAVSRLLRRSGFYHGAADGQPVRRLWAQLRPHLAS